MALHKIDGPDSYPVTLTEVKAHLDIDYDERNAPLTAYIKAATGKLERRCARSFTEQTWELRTVFPAAGQSIEIPRPPMMSVTTFTYIDDDGDTQTLEEDVDFLVIEGGDNAATLMPVDVWPTDAYDRPDAVRIRFVAGWEDVPEDLKEAIKLLVGHYENNRENVILQPTRQELAVLPDGVEAIIAPYIVPRL